MARTNGIDGALLQGLLSATGDDAWIAQAAADHTWRNVLVKVAERLAKSIGDESISWPEVRSALACLVHAGVRIGEVHLAAIAYAANDYEEAVRLWERSGSTERGEYIRAKAHITPFPDSLVWFGRLKDNAEVLRQWREHDLERSAIGDLDVKVVGAVADAALDEGDLSLAAGMVEERPDRGRVARLIAAALKSDDATTASSAAVVAARLFVQSRAWKASIRAADDADFSELPGVDVGALRSSLEKTGSRAAVLGAVVHELAVSESLPAEPPDRQGPVTEFLLRHFIGKGGKGGTQTDAHGVQPQVVGAAIERAGKIVDALQYYENLGRAASTPDVERLAAERLVRNLERHAEYFRSREDDVQARQRESRAKQIRDRTGIGARVLPDYPVVDAKKMFLGPTEWLRGPFKIVLSRSHGRLRIEHTERFETVTVDVNDRRLLGDATFSEVEASSGDSISWQIDGWETSVALVTGDGEVRLRATFAGRPFEISLGSQEAE